MVKISDDEPPEVEAMRKDDGSWHPCRVSLSSSGGIILDFGWCFEEDTIVDKHDALRRLRFRSIPLQHGECQHVKQGECVLALYKEGARNLFFDAVIEKPFRVRHSNRVYCRCTFKIEWLNSELKGKISTVPSSSIMRLSSKGIDSHPLFSAFLNSLNPTKDWGTPPFLSVLEETSCEADIDRILEQQIQEIGSLVDGSKECSAHSSGEDNKDDVSEPAMKRAPTNNQNSVTKPTRRPNKRQFDEELNELQKESTFLTPLAARAALASSIHALSWKPELIFCHAGEDFDRDVSTKNPKKHVKRTEVREPSSPTIMKPSVQSATSRKLNGVTVPRRITRSAARKGVLNLTDDQSSSIEKLSSSLSTTRSTCSGEQDVIIAPEMKQDLVMTGRTQHRERALAEDLIIPVKNKSAKRRSTYTAANSDKSRASTCTVLEENQGDSLVDEENTQACNKKSISPEKPVRRFSPRLRFLPQTRSQ